MDTRVTFEVHTPLPSSARTRSRLDNGKGVNNINNNNNSNNSLDDLFPPRLQDDEEEEESSSEPTTPVHGVAKPFPRGVASSFLTSETVMDVDGEEEEDEEDDDGGGGFVHGPDFFEANLKSPGTFLF